VFSPWAFAVRGFAVKSIARGFAVGFIVRGSAADTLFVVSPWTF